MQNDTAPHSDNCQCCPPMQKAHCSIAQARQSGGACLPRRGIQLAHTGQSGTSGCYVGSGWVSHRPVGVGCAGVHGPALAEQRDRGGLAQCKSPGFLAPFSHSVPPISHLG
eukprot:3940619-Rhodomonas_salina.3